MKIIQSLDDLVKQVTDEIISSFDLPIAMKQNTLLVFGGFQGTGKTTIIDMLVVEHGMLKVSLDVIRKNLFDKGFEFDEKFNFVVEEVGKNLLEYLLSRGVYVVFDTNVTQKRMVEMNIIGSKHHYDIKSILFTADITVLGERLTKRRSKSDEYRGKVNELRASLKKHDKFNRDDYDLAIDTEINSIEKIYEMVKDFLSLDSV